MCDSFDWQLSLTGLQSERTFHSLQIFIWQMLLVSGRSRWWHLLTCTVKVVLEWSWRHRTWRCCDPRPHVLLHSDHSPMSQLNTQHNTTQSSETCLSHVSFIFLNKRIKCFLCHTDVKGILVTPCVVVYMITETSVCVCLLIFHRHDVCCVSFYHERLTMWDRAECYRAPPAGWVW